MDLLQNRFKINDKPMAFSVKVILADRPKADGTRAVVIQAIIDRKRAVINIGFAVAPQNFVKGKVKGTDNASGLNLIIGKMLGRAHDIAINYRLQDRLLTIEDFKNEMKSPINKSDFIAFAESELAIRKGTMLPQTYDQHKYSIEKMKMFKKEIPFSKINLEMIQKYEVWETAQGNQVNTVSKTLGRWKYYIRAALKKGIMVNNPFENFTIKKVKPPKSALTIDEFKKLVTYYNSHNIPGTHKHTLRYFLFCCCNGIRISDIEKVTWEMLNDKVLTITPTKTKSLKKVIHIPLSSFELQLLPKTKTTKTIFDCYAKPVTNRYLKQIAKVESVKIHKTLTFHMSRHTFGTMFLEKGGRVEVLQQLMGHSDIDTTMVYVHMSDSRKTDQKAEAFNDFKDILH